MHIWIICTSNLNYLLSFYLVISLELIPIFKILFYLVIAFMILLRLKYK